MPLAVPCCLVGVVVICMRVMAVSGLFGIRLLCSVLFVLCVFSVRVLLVAFFVSFCVFYMFFICMYVLNSINLICFFMKKFIYNVCPDDMWSSPRAIAAYDSGLFPLWRFPSKLQKFIKDSAISPDERHRTGMYNRRTNFYSLVRVVSLYEASLKAVVVA